MSNILGTEGHMDAGIKQNVSHLIGITNVMHDADALAWFKANNPFVEPDVLSQIGAHTDIYFTNLLYFRPEEEAAWYGEAQTNKTAYTYLLEEFAFEHLRGEIELEFIPCAIFNTYADFFAQVRSQMPKPLADYLDNRYVLTEQPHFPLPEGYESADHYLIDVVMDGAKKRYKNHFTDKVAARIRRELSAIRLRHVADIFLITWDYMLGCINTAFVLLPEPTVQPEVS